MSSMIRAVTPKDCKQICAIYNHYVAHTTITFEEDVVAEPAFEKRVNEIANAFPYLVFEKEGIIYGYAYATTFRTRIAYRYNVETSVYVHKEHFKEGIGKALYMALIEALKNTGYRSAIGGITLPNDASVQLHEKLGFKKVGHFKEVGYKFDQWLDVGFWQLMLDK